MLCRRWTALDVGTQQALETASDFGVSGKQVLEVAASSGGSSNV